jgi:hypothetical protein
MSSEVIQHMVNSIIAGSNKEALDGFQASINDKLNAAIQNQKIVVAAALTALDPKTEE